MKLRLEINQRLAKIGLRTTPPQTSVKQKPAEVKQKTVNGELKIESKPVKVKIDQKKARAALNYKHYKIYGKDIAKRGKQTALKAIAEYSSQGDQLARIEKKGKPLIAQAKKNAYGDKKKVGLKWKPGPEISVTPGQQDINFEVKDLNGIKLDTEPNWPQIDLQWGKVEAYQKQKAELEIKAVDKKV
ncbi:DUF6470 family protein [Acetohalobium arabaticum]|uniref:Uncharacterized protein n=1 Tax=Acetohalobium arabaticum (strain ATCC 49924 / DSM 5501 / Z-7288) TaxID=574087 RepID=D9QTN5_ACEAZ|nr:DUF6470 family protein [Acetohalobium arabaticum]ADL11799.1 conserved hypothetical protein [Acetohalobium arabaticum DSM 5501]